MSRISSCAMFISTANLSTAPCERRGLETPYIVLNVAPMAFITDKFLLHSKTAQHLYARHASAQPIVDYHCHLSPQDLAENRRFENLAAIWLEGDHYKWRAMRANGMGEEYCTGDAKPYEKFLAWAATVPQVLRNPLYHWAHLELLRYFDIDDLLNPATAPEIWKRANQKLRS